MTSTTFFFVFIPLLAIILLAVNLIFAPHNPYQEKDSAFECGFHSFLGQNRTQFSISFFIFALLFLLFDLEILLVYPYVVSAYTNGIYGLTIMLIFFLALTLGFAFELGKNALKIDSRQTLNLSIFKLSTISHISSFKFSIHRNMSKYPLSIFFSIVFLVSLLTIIIYYMDINVLKKYLDIYTLLGCGLMSWSVNNGFTGWLIEYLGLKGKLNLSHLFLNLNTHKLGSNELPETKSTTSFKLSDDEGSSSGKKLDKGKGIDLGSNPGSDSENTKSGKNLEKGKAIDRGSNNIPGDFPPGIKHNMARVTDIMAASDRLDKTMYKLTIQREKLVKIDFLEGVAEIDRKLNGLEKKHGEYLQLKRDFVKLQESIHTGIVDINRIARDIDAELGISSRRTSIDSNRSQESTDSANFEKAMRMSLQQPDSNESETGKGQGSSSKN